MHFSDKDGHLTKVFQEEKHHDIARQQLNEYANRNWSRRWYICLVLDVAQLDHAVIVKYSGVARYRYLNMR